MSGGYLIPFAYYSSIRFSYHSIHESLTFNMSPLQYRIATVKIIIFLSTEFFPKDTESKGSFLHDCIYHTSVPMSDCIYHISSIVGCLCAGS